MPYLKQIVSFFLMTAFAAGHVLATEEAKYTVYLKKKTLKFAIMSHTSLPKPLSKASLMALAVKPSADCLNTLPATTPHVRTST